MPTVSKTAERKRDLPLPPHGTRSRYQHREKPCKCRRCELANTAYQQARRSRIRWQQLELFEVAAGE